MSGYQRPRNHSAPMVKLPRLPSNMAGATNINGAYALLEQADAQNVKKNLEPSFPSVLLLAPNGSSFRLSVTDAGALVLVQVPVPPA